MEVRKEGRKEGAKEREERRGREGGRRRGKEKVVREEAEGVGWVVGGGARTRRWVFILRA